MNPAFAKAAVDAFFGSDGWRKRIQEYGWELRRLDDLTVIAVVTSRRPGREGDRYTLRLVCDYYPTHPPDVRFVNPETLDYDPNRDTHHLPMLQAPYCAIHPIYSGFPPTYPYGPQLVCNSMTLGYYFSGHGPTADQIWTPGRHSIGSSILAVYNGLRSEHYNGPHARQMP